MLQTRTKDHVVRLGFAATAGVNDVYQRGQSVGRAGCDSVASLQTIAQLRCNSEVKVFSDLWGIVGVATLSLSTVACLARLSR